MPTTTTITAADFVDAFTDPDDIADATTTPDDELDAALLDTLRRLTRYDGELVKWARLRKHLPGRPSRHGEALVRLWIAHRLDLILIDGINYVIANDALDEQIAEIERDSRRPRELRVLYTR